MYDFQARLPIDHVLAAIKMVRSGQVVPNELLTLIGASLGEIGALLKQGPIFSVQSLQETDLSVDDYITRLTEANALDETQFDPGIWIPILIKVIEWLISRRQG